MTGSVRVMGRDSSSLAVSVVIATYQRNESVLELLAQLANQTLSRDEFEVIVVDDGSAIPAAPVLESAALPLRLTVLAQKNAGPAAARHRGVSSAVGSLIVIIDDDMRVLPDFLAAHLAAHEGRGHHVVLGRLRAQPDASLELFDRLHLNLLDKVAANFAADPTSLRGSSVYTGNVSFRREEYLRIGGFDPAFRISEDAELGIRLEESGATFAMSDEAQSFHASDHTSVKKWMTRSVAYGRTDAAVSDKHPGIPSANPWRFLFLVNPVSRPLLLTSALAPWLTAPIAWLAMGASRAFAALGMERIALAGTTFTFGIQYYRGLGAVPEPESGPTRLQRYLNTDDDAQLGFFGKFARCWADIKADHQAARAADARYAVTERKGSIIGDAITRIGFQMMIAYRVMRLFRALRLGIFAKLTSRMIRHLYSADIHWDAQLAPGVLLVHGVGLVLSHAAKVGPGCILFQHVTLGESIHPTRREIGGPTLEAGVHVGPGAVLLGPIVIGASSKVSPGALVMQDVPANSIVESPSAVVRSRRPAVSGEETLSAGLRAISQD